MVKRAPIVTMDGSEDGDGMVSANYDEQI